MSSYVCVLSANKPGSPGFSSGAAFCVRASSSLSVYTVQIFGVLTEQRDFNIFSSVCNLELKRGHLENCVASAISLRFDVVSQLKQQNQSIFQGSTNVIWGDDTRLNKDKSNFYCGPKLLLSAHVVACPPPPPFPSYVSTLQISL